jgi:hypothetical protein
MSSSPNVLSCGSSRRALYKPRGALRTATSPGYGLLTINIAGARIVGCEAQTAHTLVLCCTASVYARITVWSMQPVVFGSPTLLHPLCMVRAAAAC